MNDSRPMGFTWTPPVGMFAGKILEHGREIVAQPGRKRAIEFSAVAIPPGHPFAEGGRYPYVQPVYVIDDWPGLVLDWSQWTTRRGKTEVREVYCGPRTKPQTADEEEWGRMMGTMAKARVMTSDIIPPGKRWTERKLADVLAEIGYTPDDYAAYCQTTPKGATNEGGIR